MLVLEPIKISVFAKSECKSTFFVGVRLETDIVHHNGGSAVRGVWLGTANTQFIERAEREVGAIIPSKQYHQCTRTLHRLNIVLCAYYQLGCDVNTSQCHNRQ